MKEKLEAGCFGNTVYSKEESYFLHSELQKKLGDKHISKRPGPGGTQVHYVETWKIIDLANRFFGFNGWSSSIVELKADYLEQVAGGRFNVGVHVIVRVTLKDGTYHEDIGYGSADNQKTKGQAMEICKKKAMSDALKRTLRNFGSRLGLSIYDKEHLNELKKSRRRNGKKVGENDIPLNPHYAQDKTQADNNIKVKEEKPRPAPQQQQQQQQQQSLHGRNQGQIPNQNKMMQSMQGNMKQNMSQMTQQRKMMMTKVRPPNPTMVNNNQRNSTNIVPNRMNQNTYMGGKPMNNGMNHMGNKQGMKTNNMNIKQGMNNNQMNKMNPQQNLNGRMVNTPTPTNYTPRS